VGADLSVEQVLALLRETPDSLAELTADLTPGQLRTPPAAGEWSANEVLAHLRACADVWGGCITTVLAEDAPTIRAVNPRTWVQSTDYVDLAFRPSLRSFAAQRAELLAVLEPLPREAWSRTATVTGAGSPLQVTVLSYAQRLARHERPHRKQVGRIAGTLLG